MSNNARPDNFNAGDEDSRPVIGVPSGRPLRSGPSGDCNTTTPSMGTLRVRSGPSVIQLGGEQQQLQQQQQQQQGSGEDADDEYTQSSSDLSTGSNPMNFHYMSSKSISPATSSHSDVNNNNNEIMANQRHANLSSGKKEQPSILRRRRYSYPGGVKSSQDAILKRMYRNIKGPKDRSPSPKRTRKNCNACVEKNENFDAVSRSTSMSLVPNNNNNNPTNCFCTMGLCPSSTSTAMDTSVQEPRECSILGLMIKMFSLFIFYVFFQVYRFLFFIVLALLCLTAFPSQQFLGRNANNHSERRNLQNGANQNQTGPQNGNSGDQ